MTWVHDFRQITEPDPVGEQLPNDWGITGKDMHGSRIGAAARIGIVITRKNPSNWIPSGPRAGLLPGGS